MLVTVFKVIGYEMKTPEGNFLDSCVVWIYADNADQAIEKAKNKGIIKQFWVVVEVIEKTENADT